MSSTSTSMSMQLEHLRCACKNNADFVNEADCILHHLLITSVCEPRKAAEHPPIERHAWDSGAPNTIFVGVLAGIYPARQASNSQCGVCSGPDKDVHLQDVCTTWPALPCDRDCRPCGEDCYAG